MWFSFFILIFEPFLDCKWWCWNQSVIKCSGCLFRISGRLSKFWITKSLFVFCNFLFLLLFLLGFWSILVVFLYEGNSYFLWQLLFLDIRKDCKHRSQTLKIVTFSSYYRCSLWGEVRFWTHICVNLFSELISIFGDLFSLLLIHSLLIRLESECIHSPFY